MNAPCYKCADRVIGCHSNCERYKEWCAKMEKIKEKRRIEQKLNSHIFRALDNFARESGHGDKDYVDKMRKRKY